MDDKGSRAKYGNLQVIGTGLPRTGTLSLYTALEQLGYSPCHHFKPNIAGDKFPYLESGLWQKASRAQNKEERQKILRQIYAETGCKAAVDYPTSLYVGDLVEMYPEAKFIHGLRSSPQVWRRSFNDTIGRAYSGWMYHSCYLLPFYRLGLFPVVESFQVRTKEVLGIGIYSSGDDVEIYKRHNDHVREVVPDDRRLEFEPKDGWEPLCKFLGVPVPTDEDGRKLDYPHVNDSAQISKVMSVSIVTGWISWLVLLGSVGFAVRYFGLLSRLSISRVSQ